MANIENDYAERTIIRKKLQGEEHNANERAARRALREKLPGKEFLVIVCSEPKEHPDEIDLEGNTYIKLDDAFMVCNIANKVPAYDEQLPEAVAIKHAIEKLKVKNILIIGHKDCCKKSLRHPKGSNRTGVIDEWLNIGNPDEARVEHHAKVAVHFSLRTLHEYPAVKAMKKPRFLGAYYDSEVWKLKSDN